MIHAFIMLKFAALPNLFITASPKPCGVIPSEPWGSVAVIGFMSRNVEGLMG